MPSELNMTPVILTTLIIIKRGKEKNKLFNFGYFVQASYCRLSLSLCLALNLVAA